MPKFLSDTDRMSYEWKKKVVTYISRILKICARLKKFLKDKSFGRILYGYNHIIGHCRKK